MSRENKESQQTLLRAIPAIETLLSSDAAQRWSAEIDRSILVWCARAAVAQVRDEIMSDRPEMARSHQVSQRASELFNSQVNSLLQPSLRRVINCTGIVLHTGLGRAVLPVAAVQGAQKIISGYANLEFELASGRRGDRTVHVENLLCKLTGAEAACVVNNNAAAVLLSLTALANRKEVIISRGELIEIGGAFRIPEVMAKSGAKMVEVGTTNKTHLSDFADAVSARTAGILHVHTSNYRVQGFTKNVPLPQLVELAHAKGLFVLHDLGGGILIDLRRFGLPYEPVVSESIATGVDVVTFSGDKVLGGPQSGIIVGRRELIAKIKRNPLMRALRCDKLTFVLLENTLRLFLQPDTLISTHPVLRMLSEHAETVRIRAERVLAQLQFDPTEFAIVVDATTAQAGSGALPLEKIPSYALIVRAPKGKIARLAMRLRTTEPAVVGYIQDDALFLDMRTVLPDEMESLIATLNVQLGATLRKPGE